MRSALGHVLERFDPETIATTAQRNGLIEGLLAVGHKARLWDAYGRYFQNTREQAEDRFQDFFGAVFLDAYDEVAGSRDGCAARRKTGGD
jgi:FHA domain-containing protein/type VI secretion system protein